MPTANNVPQKSISTRFFYSTAILLVSSIVVLGLIQMYLFIGYFREEKETALLATIENVARIFEESESASTLPQQVIAVNVTREVLLTARASGNLIFITDSQGSTLLCNDSSDTYLERIIETKVLNDTLEEGVYTELGRLGGYFTTKYYIAGKPLKSANGDLAGYIFAASDAQALNVYIANMFSTFILSAGLMLMISSVISIVLTSHMTTPLRRMVSAASRFGQGDFSVRVPEEGDDELTQLSHSFNLMAGSLQKIDDSRSSFMGNIAHELRTPMTTIKGFIDGILDGTIPPESRQHYLGIVSEEVARLTRLIKNMLDITKLEAGEYKVNAENLDIWEVLTSVVFGAEQRIEAGHIQIVGLAPVRTMVYADRDLVHQVVYNLMDNALKFCGEGGEISFTVTQSKGMVTVTIRNTGAGISADALPFVFDRFYKEDQSRGLNTTGSGLGLHICKVLINLSGGKIWVESTEGEYCAFSFTLPTAPQKESNRKGEEKHESDKSANSANPAIPALPALPESTTGH